MASPRWVAPLAASKRCLENRMPRLVKASQVDSEQAAELLGRIRGLLGGVDTGVAVMALLNGAIEVAIFAGMRRRDFLHMAAAMYDHQRKRKPSG